MNGAQKHGPILGQGYGGAGRRRVDTGQTLDVLTKVCAATNGGPSPWPTNPSHTWAGIDANYATLGYTLQ